MAANFDKYLDVQIDTIEAPSAPPIGHYLATITGWKSAERDYDKANGGPKTPVVELSFKIDGPADEDFDDMESAEKAKGRLVTKDYDMADPWMLRKLGEETLDLDVAGLSLRDLLPQLKGNQAKLYLEQRAGQNEGEFYPKVVKVLPVG